MAIEVIVLAVAGKLGMAVAVSRIWVASIEKRRAEAILERLAAFAERQLDDGKSPSDVAELISKLAEGAQPSSDMPGHVPIRDRLRNPPRMWKLPPVE